jgi:hypothetical protein
LRVAKLASRRLNTGRATSFAPLPPDRTMFTNMMVTARSYYAFYGRFFADQWYGLNPLRYGVLLIGVGIFGWLLMKSGNKRT